MFTEDILLETLYEYGNRIMSCSLSEIYKKYRTLLEIVEWMKLTIKSEKLLCDIRNKILWLMKIVFKFNSNNYWKKFKNFDNKKLKLITLLLFIYFIYIINILYLHNAFIFLHFYLYIRNIII